MGDATARKSLGAQLCIPLPPICGKSIDRLVPRVSTDTSEPEQHVMKRIKAGLVALVLTTSFPVSAAAEPWGDGLTAYNRSDYSTALKLFRPLAEQDNPKAMFMLGAMFFNGEGVTQDYAEAVKWYRKAAEKGEATAMAHLGVMHHLGRGVPQDYAEAVKWYRKAAEQGETLAMYKLGVMFSYGEGVPRDYVEAHKWYNLAAANSTAVAAASRDMAVKARDLLASKMTDAQIGKAQRLAREWKPK